MRKQKIAFNSIPQDVQHEVFSFLDQRTQGSLVRLATSQHKLFKARFAHKKISRLNELMQFVCAGDFINLQPLLTKLPNLIFEKINFPNTAIEMSSLQYVFWANDYFMLKSMLDVCKDKGLAYAHLKALSEEYCQFNLDLFSSLVDELTEYSAQSFFHREEDVLCELNSKIRSAQNAFPAHIKREICYPNRALYPIPAFNENPYLIEPGKIRKYQSTHLVDWDNACQYPIVRRDHTLGAYEFKSPAPKILEIDLAALNQLLKMRRKQCLELFNSLAYKKKKTCVIA